MSNFITFGCWNKWYCDPRPGQLTNPLSNVIARMDAFIGTLQTPPAFVCIAGDNYYPDIRTEPPVEGQEKGKKIKTLSIPDLESGFECLSEFQKRHRGIPIDIIAGNHDIEDTKKMTIIPASPDTEASPDAEASPDDGCIITNTEIKATMHHRTMNFTMFNYRIIHTTLVIMLDSNIYCETLDDNELQCYTLLVNHTISTLNLKKLHYESPIANVGQLKTLQQSWLDIMYDAIRGHTIQNVVIVAHHPIAMYKIKNGCKFQTTYDEYLKFCYSVYSNIQKMKRNTLQFFYSCADLHTYQAGVVTLLSGDIPITIRQEIAGTGGTALEESVASISDVEQCAKKHASAVLVGYDMTNVVHSYGFLHWRINSKSGNLTARFIPTHEDEEGNHSRRSNHSRSRSSNHSRRGGTKRRHRTRRYRSAGQFARRTG